MKKLYATILIATFLLPEVAFAGPTTYTGAHFRFRNDDGSETTATWIAAEDTKIPVYNISSTIRLRLQYKISQASGAIPVFFDYQAGTICTGSTGWTLVGSSTAQAFNLVSSSNFADNDPTTAQLTAPGGTFTAGKMGKTLNPLSGPSTSAAQYTEMEWSFVPTSLAKQGTIYALRLSLASQGTALSGGYTACALVRVVNPRFSVGAGRSFITNLARLFNIQ